MKKIKSIIIKTLVNFRIKRISKVYNKKAMAFPEVKNKLKPSIILEHKKKWKAIYKGQINLKWLWFSPLLIGQSYRSFTNIKKLLTTLPRQETTEGDFYTDGWRNDTAPFISILFSSSTPSRGLG